MGEFRTSEIRGTERASRQTVLENARLLALRPFQLLEAETVAAFDRLAAYTAGVVSADVAALGFVDESQVVFAGSFGIEERRWDRAGSVFDTVVRSGDPLLVADALWDQRFCDHALCLGPGALRSFAAVPIVDENGLVLGALGAMARGRKAFETQAVADMSALARSVQRFMAELPAGEAAPPVVRGWLGVRTVRAGVGRGGLIVLSVAAGSPAEQAGVRAADILEAIDGRPLERSRDLVTALTGRVPGTVAQLRLQRGGERLERTVPMEARQPTAFSRWRADFDPDDEER